MQPQAIDSTTPDSIADLDPQAEAVSRSHTHRLLAYGSTSDLKSFAEDIADAGHANGPLHLLLTGSSDMIVRSDDHIVALSVQRSAPDQGLIKQIAAKYPALSFDVLVETDPTIEVRASATFQRGKISSNWTVSTPKAARKSQRGRHRNPQSDLGR